MHGARIAAGALSAVMIAGAALPLGAPGGAHAASPLSSFVLKKSDVPAAYKQTVNKADTIQGQAKSDRVSVATLRSKGWVGTVDSTFEKVGKNTDSQIESSIDQFKSASGISWDLSNGLKIIKQELPGTKTFTLHGFGQQAIGLRASEKLNKVPYSFLFVVFRRGSYLAGVGLSNIGTLAPPSLSQAEHYAAIVDARIKKG